MIFFEIMPRWLVLVSACVLSSYLLVAYPYADVSLHIRAQMICFCGLMVIDRFLSPED